ncbi:MAG: osmotically inducible protein OsmC [bacterium]|nr:osmotically inducible protein OsmC [bacterium]
MEISFPGGMGVDSHFKGHTIHTDQPETAGGQDSGPAPFDLFLASIGTCAGFYAARFCEQRQIATGGLRVTLEPVRDQKMQRIGKIRIELKVPADFPEKYRKPLVRAVDQCAVKRHILEPPEFEVVTS